MHSETHPASYGSRSPTTTAAEAPAGTQQYLTFRLDDEIFAIEIPCVREVLEMTSLTRIPRMPAFVRGVINLRGRIVPVVDLKRLFDMGDTATTIDTCIVIVEASVDDEVLVVGALADSVWEVAEIDSSCIERPPSFGARVSNEFLEGMGRKDDRLMMILDMDRVFTSAESRLIGEAAERGRAAISGDDSDHPDAG